jgi:hypothetical protein
MNSLGKSISVSVNYVTITGRVTITEINTNLRIIVFKIKKDLSTTT